MASELLALALPAHPRRCAHTKARIGYSAAVMLHNANTCKLNLLENRAQTKAQILIQLTRGLEESNGMPSAHLTHRYVTDQCRSSRTRSPSHARRLCLRKTWLRPLRFLKALGPPGLWATKGSGLHRLTIVRGGREAGGSSMGSDPKP